MGVYFQGNKHPCSMAYSVFNYFKSRNKNYTTIDQNNKKSEYNFYNFFPLA